MCLSRWSGEVQTNVIDPAKCSSSSRSLGAIHCEPIGSTGCRLIIFILRLSRRASHDWSDGSVSASCTQSGTGSASAALRQAIDRKSTRLNSSHLGISYAVFCLKKKKIIKLQKLNK